MACFSTTGNLHPLSPTRVEAVIALTWKASIEAAKVTSSKDQASKTWMSLPVNIRRRMVPPLSDNSLGNIWLPALTPLIEMDEMVELNDYAKLVRKTVRKVDGDYVSKFQQGDAIGISQVFLETFNEEMLTMIEDCPSYRYSSWMGFPLYERDFGWGKPTWVYTLGVPSKWYFNLLPTRSGDGIEAWGNLSEEDMQQFERNPELLQFASLAS
ncbi:hypothetical protein L6164_013590 [Bauhinia variegata]|uniref:Uncharacterized protein n=1 Tax=Bauhinia variegata TaxID=167791 RepID=A0ACB9NEN5_BAUVA|nr:hypothetical protein L6164_013590 [Bauhinia variegata]